MFWTIPNLVFTLLIFVVISGWALRSAQPAVLFNLLCNVL